MKRYRVKKSIEYQKWSVWTVGLEYSSLVMETVKKDLLRSWKFRFGEVVTPQSFIVLSGLRLYSATTGFDKMDMRHFCKFMVENKIMVKSFIIKTFAYMTINVLHRQGFISEVSRDSNRTQGHVFALTNKSRMLFRDFDDKMKKFFLDPLVIPSENRGRRNKNVNKPEKPKYRTRILVRGKSQLKYCDNLDKAKIMQTQAKADGIDYPIEQKVKRKNENYPLYEKI